MCQLTTEKEIKCYLEMQRHINPLIYEMIILRHGIGTHPWWLRNTAIADSFFVVEKFPPWKIVLNFLTKSPFYFCPSQFPSIIL